jgi:hypothetical protein
VKVSDLIARFGPEIMDMDADEVVLIGFSYEAGPAVASTLQPENTRALLGALAEGDWSKTRDMLPN